MIASGSISATVRRELFVLTQAAQRAAELRALLQVPDIRAELPPARVID